LLVCLLALQYPHTELKYKKNEKGTPTILGYMHDGENLLLVLGAVLYLL